MFLDILRPDGFILRIQEICGQNDLPHAKRHDERRQLDAADEETV